MWWKQGQNAWAEDRNVARTYKSTRKANPFEIKSSWEVFCNNFAVSKTILSTKKHQVKERNLVQNQEQDIEVTLKSSR